MQTVLLATDSEAVFTEVDSALGSSGVAVQRIRAGRDVRGAVLGLDPDLVILDLQIGSMGGVAACLDLRLEEGADRVPSQRILMLLDREADVFIARRSGADGWLLKPLEARRIAKAATAVLAGESYTEGPALVEV